VPSRSAAAGKPFARRGPHCEGTVSLTEQRDARTLLGGHWDQSGALMGMRMRSRSVSGSIGLVSGSSASMSGDSLQSPDRTSPMP
jgi:hypothetical protein